MAKPTVFNQAFLEGIKGDTISETRNSKVFKGTIPPENQWHLPRTDVAIKKIDRSIQSYNREIELLPLVHGHPNINTLIGYAESQQHNYLVYEFFPKGCVSNNLNGLTWRQTITILQDVASAIDHLRSKELVHGDLKLDNIVLCEDGHASLIDFGSVGFYGQEVAGYTHGFMPRSTLKRGLRCDTDLYAFGVIILQLISKRRRVVQDEKHVSEWTAMQNLKTILDRSLATTGCSLQDAERLVKLGLAMTKELDMYPTPDQHPAKGLEHMPEFQHILDTLRSLKVSQVKKFLSKMF